MAHTMTWAKDLAISDCPEHSRQIPFLSTLAYKPHIERVR